MTTWPWMTTMTMTNRSLRRITVLFSLLAATACFAPGAARADDFGNIVRHIEARYNVHRQHRIVLGLAGMVVKVWHVGGVKEAKVALFENRRMINSALDRELDEIVQQAGGHGWRAVVRSYSRRSGDHHFIYAREFGPDIQMLVVNVEPNEAVVVQVRMDQDKFFRMINGEDSDILGTQKRRRPRDAQPTPAVEVDVALARPALN